MLTIWSFSVDSPWNRSFVIRLNDGSLKLCRLNKHQGRCPDILTHKCAHTHAHTFTVFNTGVSDLFPQGTQLMSIKPSDPSVKVQPMMVCFYENTLFPLARAWTHLCYNVSDRMNTAEECGLISSCFFCCLCMGGCEWVCVGGGGGEKAELS